MKKLIFGVALVAAAAVGSAAEWGTSWHGALKQAGKQKKPMMVLFTGSDWCHWCKKLESEVFAKKEFKSWADKKVVLLKIDFPRQKPMSKSQMEQNKALKDYYQIKGYPTVLFITAQGKVLGQLGYEEGGAAAWTARADQLFKSPGKE